MKENILATRKNAILTTREGQLDINLAALRGGREYVNLRLSRFAGESKISWDGGFRKTDGAKITGRREQSHCIPYLRRIADKYNQYLFSTKPDRGEVDDVRRKIFDNITRDGTSIDTLINEVNDMVTACRWCWIGVDVPRVENPATLSRQLKEAQEIRPYWVLYSPKEVVDWAFSSTGQLLWLITEGVEEVKTIPTEKIRERRFRAVWEPGKVTKIYFKKDTSTKIESQEEIPLSYTGVPFVLVGTPTKDPYIFDDLESINRSIMDLESCNRQNYFKTVFPLLVMPKSVVNSAAEVLGMSAADAVQYVVGFSFPILVNKEDPQASYLMPNTAAFDSMQNNIGDLRVSLYETAGLLLRKESREAQTAESKAWDYFEMQQALMHRAGILEEAERKAVAISRVWDKTFPEYSPVYSRSFDIQNLTEDVGVLVQTAQVPMPNELARVVLNKLFQIVRKIGTDSISDEEATQVNEAIRLFEGTDYQTEPVLTMGDASGVA